MKDTTTERVGRYQLLEPIGVGPCGTVSRAKVFGVAGFERQFAVKRFHPELTITAALAQALSAAARSYGSLEHPRIARMSEFGVAQGQTFTAVEYVPGLDALRLIAEARLGGTGLAAGGALALVSQAARAVGYAHGRGLVHLGLAPTNVIVTADGDVKITDFAVLAAGLPQRPIDVARLAQRIQYLAPEQLANEATSAATDVFALGVLAYELVTGQRTFRGDTPQQVAHSIMNGPPPEPSLPRPIVRVLHRCLARSPFERFPDARALADALDAALRVAPVPGTRKDIGAQVKDALERIAALHEGEMSGVLALNLGTGPLRREEPPLEIATLGRESQPELATNEFVRPDTPVAGPTPLVGPAVTFQDLPRPITTMTGLPPMPIPVPQGIAPPPIPPPPPSIAPHTLLGIANAKPPPGIPTIKPPPRPGDALGAEVAKVPSLSRPTSGLGSTPRVPELPRPPAPSEPSPRFGTNSPTNVEAPSMDALFPDEPSREARIKEATTIPGHAPPQPPPTPPASARPDEYDSPTREMPPLLAERLDEASARGEESPPLLAEVWSAEPTAGSAEEAPVAVEVWPRAEPEPELSPEPEPELSIEAEPETAVPVPAPAPSPPAAPPPSASARMRTPSVNEANIATLGMRKQPEPPRKSRTPLLVAAIVIGGAAIGIGGWQLYNALSSSEGKGSGTKVVTPAAADAAPIATTTPDAEMIATAPADAAAIATARADAAHVATAPADAATVAKAPADAAQVATAPADAAKPPADAAVVAAKADAGTAAATGDSLTITSTPAGAHVYLDGAESGVTPLKLPGTGDRHTIALLLAGHELYIAQVDGHGAFAIPLKELTPTAGPAGIKVLKCKDKDRYYVFVDGKPTGQMCPTERIETDVGPHTVEVYDAGTESRKKWDIVVKDTRLSYRVKIE